MPKCQCESLVSKQHFSNAYLPFKTLRRYDSRSSRSTSSIQQRMPSSRLFYNTVDYSASKKSKVRINKRSLNNNLSDDDSPLQDNCRLTRVKMQSSLPSFKNRFAAWMGPEPATRRTYIPFKTAKHHCISNSSAPVRTMQYVLLEEPLKVSSPAMSFGEPGLYAVRSGTDKAFLFRCSCGECNKLRRIASLRRYEQLHNWRRCNSVAHKQRSYKHKKKYKEKNEASTKLRSDISTHSR